MGERRGRAPRPWIRVRLDDARDRAWVSGMPGTRDLLLEAGERKPFWVGRQKAWGTTAAVASDLLAVAQRAGWAIDFQRIGGESDG